MGHRVRKLVISWKITVVGANLGNYNFIGVLCLEVRGDQNVSRV